MSVEEIVEFLRSRDLSETLIKSIEDEKIDSTTVLGIEDVNLAKFVPRLGDRVALKNYCSSLKKPTKGTSKRSDLFDLLKKKISTMDSTNSEARVKQTGLGRKQTRRIEIGWIHNHKQIRKRMGGGTRKIDVSRNAVKSDILKIGQDLFFPNGISSKGSKDQFDFELLDFKETAVPDEATVAECYDLFKTGIVTFYVHSTASDNPTQPIDPQNARSMRTRSMLSKTEDSNDEDELPEISFKRNRVVVPALVPEVDVQPSTSANDQLAYEQEHTDLLNEAIQSVGGLSKDDVTLPDIRDEEIIFDMSREETVPENSEHSGRSQSVELTIHLGTLAFKELLCQFKDPDILDKVINIVRILPTGETERAQDTGGVLKDTLTDFWKQFFSMCTVGRMVKVPTLRHDFAAEEWRAVARVLVYGWQVVGYWPVLMSKTFVKHCLFPEQTISNDELMTNFFDYVSLVDKELFQTATQDFGNVDMDELLEALDTHDCKTRVNRENISAVLLEIAHKDIIQSAMFVSDCMRDILQCANISLPRLEEVYCSLTPTNRAVARILDINEPRNKKEDEVRKFLKTYVKEIDAGKLRRFLRFCTGSDLMITERISVELIPMSVFQRRPIGHTCGNVLQLSNQFDSYMEFRSEFDNVLESNIWVMDII